MNTAHKLSIRMVYNLPFNSSVRHIYDKENVKPIKEHVSYSHGIFAYSAINNLYPECISEECVPDQNPRRPLNLKIPNYLGQKHNNFILSRSQQPGTTYR